MFWRFGGYANISTIDTILEKPDFTIEDLLEESDLIQELKQHNTKLIEYLREEAVLQKLLDYVVAPRLEPIATPENDEQDDDKGKARLLPFSRPRASSHATSSESEEEESEKKRNRYAYVAAEVLSSDTWSICEALMENRALLRNFWQFPKRSAPLDPLQASYFTKVNEALFDKKTEEMIDLLKSIPDAIADLLRHVECPMIMDLLLKIIALDRTEGGHGIVEWLYSQDVIPTLLACLGPEHNWVVQTAAGDFMKAIITISANASQNEQQCIGPNELTRQLVSKPCVEQLIKYMLEGGNPLTVGVGIVIEVIRKNNSDYDPDVGTEASALPSSRDPIYLGTLLRLFAQHVPDFMNLIMNAPAQKQRLESTFGNKIEPLGFDRFKTCELMAELLHCSNMGLLNEVGSEELISARDAERQRLRSEGRLIPIRVDDAPPSAEDLTIRVAHSPEEGRRLEITNISDDDGFEEVEHSKEMNEDTSHEFVKAEDEIPAAVSASPLLERDDDDFVEEPLTSPKLEGVDAAPASPQFEDPDLVVAPLSPTKPKSQPAEESSATVSESDKISDAPAESTVSAPGLQVDNNATTETSTDVIPAQDGKAVEEPKMTSDSTTPSSAASEGDSKEDEDLSSSVVYTPSESTTSEAKVTLDETNPADVPDATIAAALEPQPEDVPAPLFAKTTSDEDADNEEAKPPKLPSLGVPETSLLGLDESDSPDGPQFPEPAAPPPPTVVVSDPAGEKAAAETSFGESGSISPVVGDYLKTQFVEYRVVPTILSFFFAYPWNNFLHNVVYDIVQQVFNGPMDRGYNPTLAVSLFEAADITTAIINGQIASDESQAKTKTRMGYMGHLTLIAEEVVKFTERHPPELLSETVLDRVMDQSWISYVEGSLAETRERDNAILGGVRPEVALGNRAGMSGGGLAAVGLSGLGSALGLGGSSQSGGSNALAEAGLNGGMDLQENNGNGIGPFAISAGTLMSGFGSSSDEEDEDGEDNDDDVTNEFRAYTDPLSQNSSMNPPSIPPPPPPPPPPLNVPPSRARLQLAARLAMHQKNNAAATSAGSRSDSNGDAADDDGFKGSNDEPERLRNPFADDEDDDDVDSDDGNDDGLRDNSTAGVGAGAWGAAQRGSWWRSVVRRRQNEQYDGRDDSDEEDDDEEDEEFGDFAMPEAEPAPGTDPNEKVLIKPLAVHPPSGLGGANAKSSFGSLWPFTAGVGVKEPSSGATEEGQARESGEKPLGEATGIAEPVGEDGQRVRATVEAKRRTSIEDPDEDEEVVRV